jgi:hypothetical protein
MDFKEGVRSYVERRAPAFEPLPADYAPIPADWPALNRTP